MVPNQTAMFAFLWRNIWLCHCALCCHWQIVGASTKKLEPGKKKTEITDRDKHTLTFFSSIGTVPE